MVNGLVATKCLYLALIATDTASHKRQQCFTECELPVSLGDGADPESQQHPCQFGGEGLPHATSM